MLTALIVDDSPTFLATLRRLLVEAGTVEVVGEATSGEQAVAEAARLGPDLVLMDLAMPGIGGLEASRRITARPEPPRVIAISLDDTAEHRLAARAAGAAAFVPKAEVRDFIRTLGEGRPC